MFKLSNVNIDNSIVFKEWDKLFLRKKIQINEKWKNQWKIVSAVNGRKYLKQNDFKLKKYFIFTASSWNNLQYFFNFNI